MTATETVELLKAIADLLGVLVWPAVALFVLVRFGPGLKEFFNSLSELTFKAAGVEAIAKRRQAEVAAALGAASAKGGEGRDGGAEREQASPRDIAESVASRVTSKNVLRLEGARVLWVDDVPANNAYSRRALEALGINFDISLSTDEALEKAGRRRYDVIISDMGRPPDHRAGYTLLDALRQRGVETPYIIFATEGNLPDNRKEARSHGARGSTNDAQELFEMVISALVDA